ncbi:hypothetical protein Tco_0946572 [Tanacetum coccineum]
MLLLLVIDTQLTNEAISDQVNPKVVEMIALSKPVTSKSTPSTKESKVVKNDKVRVLEEYRRLHEELELKRRSKLKLNASRHLLDEPTRGMLNETARGIFLYKSPNQAFQFLDDKVLFKLDWSTKSQNEHHQKSVAFADGSNSNDDNSRLMETLEALTIKMDSKFQSLKEEMHEMRKNYINREGDHASKNDDTPMCERQEANFIQSQELNNDVKNNLKDFKRCIRSMRTVHDKLFDRDDQSKTDLEKSITNLGWSKSFEYMSGKSQNVSLEQTDRTIPPPPPQTQTEQVNAVFTGSRKSDDSPKT